MKWRFRKCQSPTCLKKWQEMGKDARTPKHSLLLSILSATGKQFVRKKWQTQRQEDFKNRPRWISQYKTDFNTFIRLIIKSFYCSKALVKSGLFQTLKAKSYQSIFNKIPLASRTFSKDVTGLSINRSLTTNGLSSKPMQKIKEKHHFLPWEHWVHSNGFLFFLLFFFLASENSSFPSVSLCSAEARKQ